jgi:hypothetical protein
MANSRVNQSTSANTTTEIRRPPMKSVILGMLFASFLSSPAMASNLGLGRLECNNGTIEEVGDGLFELTVLRDRIEFRPYESGFTIRARDMVRSGNTIAALAKTVKISAEGEESTVLINAILIFSNDRTKANLATSYDGSPFYTQELSCVKK